MQEPLSSGNLARPVGQVKHTSASPTVPYAAVTATEELERRQASSSHPSGLGRGRKAVRRARDEMERETGLEPATFSLEG